MNTKTETNTDTENKSGTLKCTHCQSTFRQIDMLFINESERVFDLALGREDWRRFKAFGWYGNRPIDQLRKPSIATACPVCHDELSSEKFPIPGRPETDRNKGMLPPVAETAVIGENQRKGLKAKWDERDVTCPVCFNHFPLSSVKVSMENNNEYCTCPHCEVGIPMEAVTTNLKTYISLIGTPNSGRTAFLGTLFNELKILKKFQTEWRTLPFKGCTDILISIHDEIYNRRNIKVNLREENQHTGFIDGKAIKYPLPIVMELYNGETTEIVLIYDINSRFLLNENLSISQETMRHILMADGIIFALDPLQDENFFNRVENISGNDVPLKRRQDVEQIEQILKKITDWIDEQLPPENPKSLQHKELAIVATKFDAWQNLLTLDISRYQKAQKDPLPDNETEELLQVLDSTQEEEDAILPANCQAVLKRKNSGNNTGNTSLNINRIKSNSLITRLFLKDYFPEMINISSRFNTVRFFPVSSLGVSVKNPDYLEFPKPLRVTDPLLWILSRKDNGTIKRDGHPLRALLRQLSSVIKFVAVVILFFLIFQGIVRGIGETAYSWQKYDVASKTFSSCWPFIPEKKLNESRIMAFVTDQEEGDFSKAIIRLNSGKGVDFDALTPEAKKQLSREFNIWLTKNSSRKTLFSLNRESYENLVNFAKVFNILSNYRTLDDELARGRELHRSIWEKELKTLMETGKHQNAYLVYSLAKTIFGTSDPFLISYGKKISDLNKQKNLLKIPESVE